MTRKLSYDDLKKENRKALSALITLWEELSRCSRESARKDLKENWGFRYKLISELNSGSVDLTFKDSHSGDIFNYSTFRKEWL
jgi:hypothetical protein